MCVRFPLSLRNVEDLLHERGIDISHETVRFWWNRFGPLFFAAEVRKTRVSQMRAYARGEHWEERVMLADWWAGYLNEIAAK
jgi:transposase-like protein